MEVSTSKWGFLFLWDLRTRTRAIRKRVSPLGIAVQELLLNLMDQQRVVLIRSGGRRALRRIKGVTVVNPVSIVAVPKVPVAVVATAAIVGVTAGMFHFRSNHIITEMHFFSLYRNEMGNYRVNLLGDLFQW